VFSGEAGSEVAVDEMPCCPRVIYSSELAAAPASVVRVAIGCSYDEGGETSVLGVGVMWLTCHQLEQKQGERYGAQPTADEG